MKVHKASLGEDNAPGSIWAAIIIAKGEHIAAMRFKREGKWELELYCRRNRDTMMRTIRVIARGAFEAVRRINTRAAARCLESEVAA